MYLDIFKTSSASFSEKFDGSKDKLPALKAEIMARAPIGGWDSQGSGVINIPSEHDPNVKINIVKEHPKVTVEWVKTWTTNNFVGQSNMMAQNNFNMFTALESSIESKFKSGHLVNDEEKFTVAENLYSLMICHEEEIVTLKAELQVVKSQQSQKRNNPKTNGGKEKGPGTGNKENKSNDSDNKSQKKIVYADWMLIAPTEGQAKTKTVND